jgi:hypothetical protein
MSEYNDQNSNDLPVETQDESGGPPEMGSEQELNFVAEDSPKTGRNATLMLVGFLIVGAGAIYFMRLRTGPAVVKASPTAATAEKTIKDFVASGPQNIKSMQDLLTNTEKVVKQFEVFPTVKQVKPEELASNPFRFLGPKAVDPDKAAKELQAKVDEEKKAITAAAGKLQVQFVIHSNTVKAAMIANKQYSEGQEIDGFVIEKITPAGLVVKKHGPVADKTYKFNVTVNR